MLNTERENIKPLLGMDWLRKLNWTIRHIEKSTTQTDPSETDEIITKNEKLSKTKKTFKDTEIRRQLKPGNLPLKQKDRPIPHHLQNFVEKETDKLIKSGHLEKVQKLDENCFVSSVVIAVKKEKSVNSALNSRKSNDSCPKMRPHMPNIADSLNQISIGITRPPNEPLWIWKLELEYACCQLELTEETSRQYNFAITGRYLIGFY